MSDLSEQVRETMADVEWLIFGTWDTPRCPWCKGWKKAGGHKPNCKRQKLLAVAGQPQQAELFRQGQT